MEKIMYKKADSTDEIEQIHKLNYKTFVKEIPQHHQNIDEKLIDKFHNENIYFIAKLNNQVIGMIAYRDKRPFSLDQKLENLDEHLKIEYNKLCEIRLLSVEKQYRKSNIFANLIFKTIEFSFQNSCDIALISGILNQQKLYKNIGFIPFGPIVGKEKALYQPMYLHITKQLRDRIKCLIEK